MKFSIITPAHKKTPYIKELYDSIVAQTYENWEMYPCWAWMI